MRRSATSRRRSSRRSDKSERRNSAPGRAAAYCPNSWSVCRTRPVLEWSLHRKRCRLNSQQVEPMTTGEQHGVSRRLAAILGADVVGYSRLMEGDEVATLRALKAHRRELVDPAIAGHHGRIVKTTGDGLLVEFHSIVDAVTCALGVQRGMIGRNVAVPEDRRIVFRIGINIGDILS